MRSFKSGVHAVGLTRRLASFSALRPVQKLGVYAIILLTWLLASFGVPRPASAVTITTEEPIPIVVVGPARSNFYPQPICSKCKIVAERQSNANGTPILLFISFKDSVYPEFRGSIRVTMLFSGDMEHVEIIQDVAFVDGDEFTVVLPDLVGAPSQTAELLWVELVPTV